MVASPTQFRGRSAEVRGTGQPEAAADVKLPAQTEPKETGPPVSTQDKVEALLARGVVVPCPVSVEVGDEVDPERIAPGVVIHSGCRITGARTSIGPGSELGAEAPATVEDCQLGRNVDLKGGYFSGAVFLDGANMGSAAHVRPGTLLEEEAGGAHAVGFKQTLLLPFVTAGSLVNFCDALMAGGTSRQNHSEIGSSYIHFNFTPHRDKATPSLVGDVPRGVMLDQAPIFLGGQGGLVGPARIAYGTVIPAGLICRQDITDENGLYTPPPEGVPRAFRVGAYRSIRRIVLNNLTYVGNLQALKLWYLYVRRPVMTADPFSGACCDGALAQIEAMLDERVKRLKDLSERMVRSLELARADSSLALPPALAADQEVLVGRWPEIETQLRASPAADKGAQDRDAFLSAWEKARAGSPYLEAVASLAVEAKKAGTAWLQAVVDSATALWKTEGR
jgi:bifunctional UDP-N-acetylglucosamine pyrophosphorylase/glucosamine-1-phosphate N-acetyltransferase